MTSEPMEHSGGIFSRENTMDDCVAQPIPVGCSDHTVQERLRVIKNGDRIEAIEIQCLCGKFIRVNCKYD